MLDARGFASLDAPEQPGHVAAQILHDGAALGVLQYLLGVLAVIGVVVDTVAQTAGAQRAGASKEGILGSLIGTVVGVFLGGIVGILIMPLIGAAIGEFWAKRDLLHAGRVGLATWIGMIIGTVVKVALAFTMTGTLFAVYFL